jgi:hypothetical protein
MRRSPQTNLFRPRRAIKSLAEKVINEHLEHCLTSSDSGEVGKEAVARSGHDAETLRSIHRRAGTGRCGPHV